MVAPPVVRRASVGAIILSASLMTAAAADAQRAWAPPVSLTPAQQQSKQPQLAMDGSGNAVATWIREQGSGPTSRVTQGARMAATGFWTRAQDLYSPPALSAVPEEATDVALNAAGRGAAVWVRATGSAPADQIVQAAIFTGTGWGMAMNVMPASAAGVASARVGVDSDGNAVAVWVQELLGFSVVRASRYTSGATWSAPVTVSPATENVAEGVVLAVDDTGDAVAAWTALPGGVGTIRAARFTELTATWSAATSIGPAGRSPYAVHLAVNQAGTAAFVAFRGYNGANDIARVARLDPASGVWSSPIDVSLPGRDVFDMDIAVDEQGRAVAVWSRFDGSFRTVQTARYSGGWSTPSDRSSGVDTHEARIDTDPAGNAVAAWTALLGSTKRVQSASFAMATGTWTPAADVSTGEGDAAAPRVRLHSDGAAVIVWQSESDFFYIQSSRYVLESSPVLQQPSVNRNTVSVAWAQGAGPAPDGYTVVATSTPGGAPMTLIPVGTKTSVVVSAQDGAYYVRVLASISGQQVSSNEVEVIVGAGAAPTAPQNLAAVVNGSTFTMTWSPPANVPPVTVLTYYIEAGNMAGSNNLAFFPTGSAQTSFSTPSLPDGSYWVRVRAESAGGLSPVSPEVRVTIGPPPPRAPVLSGGPTGPGTVLLQWTAAAAPGAAVTGYQIRAGYQPGQSNATVFDLPASALSYGAVGIPAGTYYVRVVALSSAGPGDASNEVVVTVVP